MHDDRLVYYLNNQSPEIRRTLSTATGSIDVTADQTFRLKIRPTWSSSIVVDAEMLKDETTDEVYYIPGATDFDEEGVYKAWITVTTGGLTQDTDEFEIAVFAHAPGEGIRIGAIWRAARALAPIAWDNLRGYPEYGDPELQRVIELAKLRVLPNGTVVTPDDEQTLDPRVIDYIAKVVLVDNVLEAAIDYWTNVIVSQSAQGNSAEVKTYPDRIRATEGRLARLREQIKTQKDEVDEILNVTTGVVGRSPILLNGGLPLTPALELVPGLAPDWPNRRWEW